MLDPRFKLLWAAQENTDELVSLLQKNASSCDASISDGEDSDTSPPNKKHKSDDFFNFLPKSTPKRQRHTSERSQLVQRYLDEPTLESSADPLLFGKLMNTCIQLYQRLPKSTFPSRLPLLLLNAYLV